MINVVYYGVSIFQSICAVPGCLLYFCDVVFLKYLVQFLCRWFWDDSSYPCCHYPCYQLYARYLQLHNWNKPCFWGKECCSCSGFKVWAHLMLFRTLNISFTFTVDYYYYYYYRVFLGKVVLTQLMNTYILWISQFHCHMHKCWPLFIIQSHMKWMKIQRREMTFFCFCDVLFPFPIVLCGLS